MWTGLLLFALAHKLSATGGCCAVRMLAGLLYLDRERCVEQFLSPQLEDEVRDDPETAAAGQPPAVLNVALGSGCDGELHLPLSLVLISGSETGIVIQRWPICSPRP